MFDIYYNDFDIMPADIVLSYYNNENTSLGFPVLLNKYQV
jgi:hypothetical protein